MATAALAPEQVNEISDEEIERLEEIMSDTLTEAVEKCGSQGLPTLLRHMAKRLEREASTLDADRPPLSDEEVKASHTQLMVALGKKEENVMDVMGPSIGEGVPEVAFYPEEGKAPTFFYDTAAAVKNPTLPEGRQSWGYTTDFALFEKIIWPLFKELKEGTMAVETGISLKHGTPEWEARETDKELAIKVAEGISRNFWTTVLATVRVQGWRPMWMLMVLYLILVSYPTCVELYLNALKGGGACDSEIGFIRAAMHGLGFECVADGSFSAEEKYTLFSWVKERPGGAERFQVWLIVHHDPDDIDVENICDMLHPCSYNATAPDLKRLAVVSAPVTDGRGERADERLNAALGKALKMMQLAGEGQGEGLELSLELF